jgi:hypothetical protein
VQITGTCQMNISKNSNKLRLRNERA